MSNNIKFSDEELKDILKHNLAGPHKDLLSDAIIGLMDDSDWKLSHLIKATLGVRPKSKHRLYDEYLVPFNSVSGYMVNENLTREAGYINGDDKIKVILIEFIPWSSAQYKVRYEYINDKGAKAKKTYEIHGSYLTTAEEFPEDYDDLPF